MIIIKLTWLYFPVDKRELQPYIVRDSENQHSCSQSPRETGAAFSRRVDKSRPDLSGGKTIIRKVFEMEADSTLVRNGLSGNTGHDGNILDRSVQVIKRVKDTAKQLFFINLIAAICLIAIPSRVSFAQSERTDTLGMSAVMSYIRHAFPESVREAKDSPSGTIGLPYPYNSPSVKNGYGSMYYFDTYFINVGLLRVGMLQQAENNVGDLLFLVNKIGFVPNANQRSMCNRSLLPFLAMMVRDIFERTHDVTWLRQVYPTVVKEYNFWMTKRMSPIGLNRPGNSATKAYLLNFYKFLKKDRLKGLDLKTEKEKLAFSSNALSECEISDFTPRFDRRANDFCPVDLNSNLYLYERILARFSGILHNGRAQYWLKKAEKRKRLIQKYLWNEKLGCYTDYDFVNKKKGNIVSCATLFPLYAGLATPEQANEIVHTMKADLEFDYGLAACEKRPERFVYQWAYPNAWAPYQYIAIRGLSRYGFKKDAREIAEKYVHTVIINYNKTGNLWEKYNAVNGGTDVANEYKMPTMLGFTAGTFVFSADYLRDHGN